MRPLEQVLVITVVLAGWGVMFELASEWSPLTGAGWLLCTMLAVAKLIDRGWIRVGRGR